MCGLKVQLDKHLLKEDKLLIEHAKEAQKLINIMIKNKKLKSNPNVIKMSEKEKTVTTEIDQSEVDSKKDQINNLIDEIDHHFDDLRIYKTFKTIEGFVVDAAIDIDYEILRDYGVKFTFVCSFHIPLDDHKAEISSEYSSLYDRVNCTLWRFLNQKFDFLQVETDGWYYEYNAEDECVVMSFYAEGN
jgi:predicted RNA-binding protein